MDPQEDRPILSTTNKGRQTVWYKRIRLQVMLILWICFILSYLDRANMSVAIISIASEFNYTETQKGVILSSFFYGYAVSQVPGGYLSSIFGGKIVLGIGVLVWSVVTILTAQTTNMILLVIVRVLLGLGEGVAFPCVHNLAVYWFPIQERTRSVAFMTSGIDLGTILALFFSPLIDSQYGWRFIFYIFGGISCVWLILFYFFVHDSPERSIRISTEELLYIQNNRPLLNHKNVIVPWTKIFSSSAVWAIVGAQTCFNYGYYVTLSWLPIYFTRLDIDKSIVGYFTFLPYVIMFAASYLVGWICDYLIRNKVRVVNVRKMSTTIAMGGPAFFFILISFTKNINSIVALLYFSGAMLTSSFSKGGYWVNHLDIAPNYSGILLGITNTFGTVPGIVGNIFTGWILDYTGNWNIVFLVASLIYTIGTIIYLFFADGEIIIE